MAGSNVRVKTKSSGGYHPNFTGRELPKQHPLEAIYDQITDKNLVEILANIGGTIGESEYVLVESNTQLLVLQEIEFNIDSDVLSVSVQGLHVVEGIDYIKIDVQTLFFNWELRDGYEVFVQILGSKPNSIGG